MQRFVGCCQQWLLLLGCGPWPLCNLATGVWGQVANCVYFCNALSNSCRSIHYFIGRHACSDCNSVRHKVRRTEQGLCLSFTRLAMALYKGCIGQSTPAGTTYKPRRAVTTQHAQALCTSCCQLHCCAHQLRLLEPVSPGKNGSSHHSGP
jgi:hypothetical protein